MLLNERLKTSEIRYRRLFESAKDGILILNFNTGKIVDANPFIIKMIDQTLQDVKGKKLWQIGLFSNREQSESAFRELKKNNYIRFEDMPIQRKDGSITEVEFISNVYLENGSKVIQCNIRDITERKKTENALKDSLMHIRHINEDLTAAKIRAEESDNLKTAFLANMSHEIRTPMNAIVGFSGFLLNPGLSHEKLASYVQIIKASSLQLLTVIGDIIDISKIETGQMIIESEPVNINNLLDELFITYKKIVEIKKIKLYYSPDHPHEPVQVETDGNRIRQILCNLLNNAIKFTTEGEIEFGYHLTEHAVEFFVKDTGIGIAPENHALVFQRFRQVGAADDLIYGGNGLGLSISSALIKRLGGNFAVVSALGKGSTFSFTVPYTKKIRVNLTSKTNPKRIADWNKKTILIVEDDINNHSLLEAMFTGTNAKLLHAWDGREAVESVENHADISLVLMDIKMPIMDGYKATRLIKHLRPKLPVIAQTAYALSHDRNLALDAGCDDYLSKPIEKETFMQKVGAYLA
jgi:PAS domain S-box-containing protein